MMLLSFTLFWLWLLSHAVDNTKGAYGKCRLHSQAAFSTPDNPFPDSHPDTNTTAPNGNGTGARPFRYGVDSIRGVNL
jgi:hypothetical protein